MTTAAPTGTPAAASTPATPAAAPAGTAKGPIAVASGAASADKRKAEQAALNDADWKAARAAAGTKPDVVSADVAERLGIDDALELADSEGETAETTEGAAEETTEGETAVEGEKKDEPVKEEPKVEVEVEPLKPALTDWKKFLKRKAETEERLEKRAARVGALETEAKQKADALLAEAQGKVKTFEAKLAAVAGLDSDDPYVVWDAIAKHKGWDLREAFQTVTRRTLHGGELSVQDQLKATETKLAGKLEEQRKEIEADREALKKERAEQAKREEVAQKQRLFEQTARGVAVEYKKALDAGQYKFLKRYTPEQIGEIATRDLVRYYQATVDPQTGLGKEVALDDYLKGWESKLQQEYEALRGLAPESAGSSSNGSETGQGNGAAAAANPGTQQANGSPQRRPTAVTRSLAAQRSEQGRPLSEAEEWEEAKRAARQREDAPR